MKKIILSFALALASNSVSAYETVTTANFVRAESDMQMQAYVKNFNAFGNLPGRFP